MEKRLPAAGTDTYAPSGLGTHTMACFYALKPDLDVVTLARRMSKDAFYCSGFFCTNVLL